MRYLGWVTPTESTSDDRASLERLYIYWDVLRVVFWKKLEKCFTCCDEYFATTNLSRQFYKLHLF